MGATVLGCGHASHLFEAVYLDGTPNVHVHFLTDEKEFRENGFGQMELVCHACGAAQLIIYDEDHSQVKHVRLRTLFRDQHLKCSGNFEGSCPDYRRSIEVLDVRRKPLPKLPQVPRVRVRKARSAR